MRVRMKHWEMLLSFCEEYPELITNKFNGSEGRAKGIAVWQTVTTKLNSLGYGEKSIEGWRKTLTDWKCKTKAKAASLRRAQQKTGGGSPQQPLLSTLENRLLGIMGVTAVIGNESVSELGFGEVEVQHVDVEMTNNSIMVEHDYHIENQIDETPTNQPSTSRANSERDGGGNKSKRKLDYQNNTGTSNKKTFRRRPMTVPLSNELLDLNRQSVELLQNVSNNTDNMARSLESIATSLKIMAEILKNSGSSNK
ncbi:uncharacterized protein [Diabrotica undecimpunctata]|uniref:uncharacterized protein n=1 Tax=Diabrotica undecimpunctata TaxID=50387 RepID=UPI003B6343F1